MAIKDYIKRKQEQLKEYNKKRYSNELKKEAIRLQQLKEIRIKEEGRATLRALKQKELKRIDKARTTAAPPKPKPINYGMGFSSGIETVKTVSTPIKRKSYTKKTTPIKRKSYTKKTTPKKRTYTKKTTPKKKGHDFGIASGGWGF